MATAVIGSAGCGDKATAKKCKAGEVHDCVCKDEHASLQTCNAVTGAWDACMCPGDAGAGGTSAGTGAGTGGSGGASGTGMSGSGGSGGMGGAGGAVAVPAYSGPCTATSCPVGQTCATTGKYCAAECTMTSGADCPASPEGTATKTCTIPALATKGACSLTCTVGTAGQCPTGMTCTAGFLAAATCTWP